MFLSLYTFTVYHCTEPFCQCTHWLYDNCAPKIRYANDILFTAVRQTHHEVSLPNCTSAFLSALRSTICRIFTILCKQTGSCRILYVYVCEVLLNETWKQY